MCDTEAGETSNATGLCHVPNASVVEGRGHGWMGDETGVCRRGGEGCVLYVCYKRTLLR